MGGTIIFDLISKTGHRKFVRSVVKSIKPTQKDYSIDCDLTINTPEEIASLTDFLGKHWFIKIATEAQSHREISRESSLKNIVYNRNSV